MPPPPPDRCCTLIDLTPGNILVRVSDSRPHARFMEGAPALQHNLVTGPFHRLQATYRLGSCRVGLLLMPPPCAALLLTLCSCPSSLPLPPALTLGADKTKHHGWSDSASSNFPDYRWAATATATATATAHSLIEVITPSSAPSPDPVQPPAQVLEPCPPPHILHSHYTTHTCTSLCTRSLALTSTARLN